MDLHHDGNRQNLALVLRKLPRRGNGSCFEIEAEGRVSKVPQVVITRITANLKQRAEEGCPPTDLEDYLFDHFPADFRRALAVLGIARVEAYQFMASQAAPIRPRATSPVMELATIIAKGIPRRVHRDGRIDIRTGEQQLEFLVNLINKGMTEVGAVLDAWAEASNHGINSRGYINVQKPNPVTHSRDQKRFPKA